MNMFKDVKEDMNKSLMKTVKTQTVELNNSRYEREI